MEKVHQDVGGVVHRGSARERVFDVASDLFYRQGIRAVGVEAIVKEAGVAKISMYRSFASKDDLILAYLSQRNEGFWRQWDENFARYENDPRAQLREIMTYIGNRTTQPGYRGCPFINYCAEFPDRSHLGHDVAEANKREMLRRFLRIAEALGAAEPIRLAKGLLLLAEGAYAISQTLGGTGGPGEEIVEAADALVEVYLQNKPKRH